MRGIAFSSQRLVGLRCGLTRLTVYDTRHRYPVNINILSLTLAFAFASARLVENEMSAYLALAMLMPEASRGFRESSSLRQSLTSITSPELNRTCSSDSARFTPSILFSDLSHLKSSGPTDLKSPLTQPAYAPDYRLSQQPSFLFKSWHEKLNPTKY
ncbi:uncharacterized protein BDR25DRAFT_362869 [Lindgomyces ingoldianus]|uniref:Uncharacterized protein n=1 Tax=Lindgomyces ingoldianus TaxID=673940 RepID=A0ACB6Q8U9_9PLEO|nr:uncharacterized protein BDR25DRAFT_362869 [Lindgomyces ingoldianus]KAF2463320.1 hypothetical protein BDR25DRAFT_362869 [Lindgomyces ingoldianus]